ncbi:hypothetical protein B0J11DRAFT_573335 [Dendryphion nanum]|uniref:Fucose-specific lectin n=1 Tax=Dendryphion nanum TaxID=256645 RepID=A0A9P9I7K1_9PLEO|nr:hypothetical protein B0J11DRAFT_573335 [Dendryphion nanum]
MSDSVTPGTAILNAWGSVDEILHFKVLESQNLVIERRPTEVGQVNKYDNVDDRTYVDGPIHNPTELGCAIFNNAITVYGATKVTSAKNPDGIPILSQLAPTYEPVVSKKFAQKAYISPISNSISVASDAHGKLNYVYFHKDNKEDSTRTVLWEYKRTVGSEEPSFKSFPDWKQPLAKSRLASVFEPFASTRGVFYQAEGSPSNYITWAWTNGASYRIDVTNHAMAGTPLAASLVPGRKGEGWFDIYLFFLERDTNILLQTTYTANTDSPLGGQWKEPSKVTQGKDKVKVSITSDLFIVRHDKYNHVFCCIEDTPGYQDIPVPFIE